ncbi:helix-turn-helix domain-containing protein [Agromyces endophyticus]|uniref:helix-turn-helix domain-containing protein n=1 Tax=Agromyces sp. H17E-10 TaxID=2932244 RepID=UPI001FD37647|nr:helix-turn-helix domain-containing protein [Agromyces sp. H17E-10]UOQ90022.1 helix-turn-helix domain-containing protein [Agromyces sp. H17E-10]
MQPSDYWRTRAGAAVKGVLAPRSGEPGLAPIASDAAAQHAANEPVRLARFPAPAPVAHVVRHFWVPRWRLPTGVVVEQGVLEYPSANLVVEPDAAALYGPSIGRGVSRLEGEGWAVGALLQPGVAGLIAPGEIRALVGGSVPVEALRLHGAAAGVARVRESAGAGRDDEAVAAFADWLGLQRLALDDDSALAARVVELAETDRSILRASELAEAAGLGLRALERLVRSRLGLTPKWLIGRYRMQEAAHRLAASDPPPIAELAAELGFSDQAHFTREFRTVIGETPRRYAAAARAAGFPRGTAPT